MMCPPSSVTRLASLSSPGLRRAGFSSGRPSARRARVNSAVRVGLIFALLAVSVPAARLIPASPFWGLDFQNVYAFHHCDAANDPYLATGVECGDVFGRDM